MGVDEPGLGTSVNFPLGHGEQQNHHGKLLKVDNRHMIKWETWKSWKVEAIGRVHFRKEIQTTFVINLCDVGRHPSFVNCYLPSSALAMRAYELALYH